MWKFVASVFADEYDYFLMGGDDLYVIVDNLRHFLNSPEIRNISKLGQQPVYLGRPFAHNLFMRYQSGGAGYLINARALKLLAGVIEADECMPGIHTSMEDVLIAQCLMHLGISVIDSHDGWGRELFHPVSPSLAFEPMNESEEWYRRASVSYKQGMECCSPFSVSFHNIRKPQYDMRCLHKAIHQCD